MGLDLTLVFSRPGERASLGYDRLHMDRDYRLFGYIKDSNPSEIAEGRALLFYDDEGLMKYDTDAYGDRLTSIRAISLWGAISNTDSWSKKNQAILEYLSNIDPDTEVFLWWH